MKLTITSFVLSCATAGYAQVWSLPPSSVLDGVTVKSLGSNGGAAHWENSTSIGAYRVSGDSDSDRITPGVSDLNLGLNWQSQAPAGALAAKNTLNARGGSMRVIFLGETAGGRNNFGYSRSGAPTALNSFTLFSDIQAFGSSPTITFGQYADFSFLSGQAGNFDFWLNAVDTSRGGVYSLFQSSGMSTSQFLWSVESISASTWIPALGGYRTVDTYVVSAEDLQLGLGADRDFSDFRFALQFFDLNGEALAAIPEPAHIAGALGLTTLGLAFYRRRKLVETA